MFHVVLHQPEIPPNTGNVMRLCANTATTLHLIHPLGFDLDEPLLRRAGLDYREWADVREHDSFDAWLAAVHPGRVVAFTRRAGTPHDGIDYLPGDALLFGPESDGLDPAILERPEITAAVRIPMVPRSRSLNLSNAVSVGLYEALRQQGFPDLATEGK
ncbi:MAG: tRNA (cytidine(34)-2'-O)-methyltransferase [Acidimicrobiia bacterium]|nr:tRNA (cytidine(34)-2'-O)-methyltransferase [Acidimicrobiia bacterium]NNF10232.1 tRNA (cytidine(34)-2'-O)-methyltransferase [Acidimicrobiia bacterium]NNL69304.1 tRNA (cytidine(34)-2'-O)-methyltransferase [Acidimicrobiia bacterium]